MSFAQDEVKKDISQSQTSPAAAEIQLYHSKANFYKFEDVESQEQVNNNVWVINSDKRENHKDNFNKQFYKSNTIVSNNKGSISVKRDKNVHMDNPIVDINYQITESIENSRRSENDLNALKVECNQENMTTFQPIHCENVLYIQRGYGGYGLGAAANIFSIRPPDALSDGHGPRNMLHALDLGVIDQTGGNGGPLYPLELDMYADGDDDNQRILEMILFQNYTQSKRAKASVGLLVGVNNDDSRFGSIVQFDGHFDHAGIDLVGAKPNCLDDHNKMTCPAAIYLRSDAKISFSTENDTFQYFDSFSKKFSTFVSGKSLLDESVVSGAHYHTNMSVDGSISVKNNIESQTITARQIILLKPISRKDIKNVKYPEDGMIANDADDHIPVIFENGKWRKIVLGGPM